jgi:hypothetical protein
MVTIALFLIGCTCLLGFWLRAFEKWDKATVVNVRGCGDSFSQIITFIVDEQEYSCSYPYSDDPMGKDFKIGEKVDIWLGRVDTRL